MSDKYSVRQQNVGNLLAWISSKEVAIPEIQRPFVWKATKVRDLIDSLYNGYPIGYLITWQNPNVKLKNGEVSRGKKILIDGQQRITALTTAINGQRVLNQRYRQVRIRIAFHPVRKEFKVLSKGEENSPEWINDISEVINDKKSLLQIIREYQELNPGFSEQVVEQNIDQLRQITQKQIGIIELAHDLDTDTVTEIFIRINQSGVVLSNADFVMSKIAADEKHGGNQLRKTIDYFCRLIVNKDFLGHILDNDPEFVSSDYFQSINWMSKSVDELYIPDYADVLRVAFTYQFNRGKFSDLVALLSGRDFEARDFKEEITNRSFSLLREGILQVVNQTNYERFLMLVKSTGFVHEKLISSKNSLNVAYALYLKLKQKRLGENEIQRYVQRWLVMTILLGRYSGSSESYIDEDIKNIESKGIAMYLRQLEDAQLNEGFWSFQLVSDLESSRFNNQYGVYLAAQCYTKSLAFLSKSITIASLLEHRGDLHHIFPKDHLKKQGFTQKYYNQIANLVYTEQYSNIKISNQSPQEYILAVKNEITQGLRMHTTLDSIHELKKNLIANDIPVLLLENDDVDYQEFLAQRRRLMAQKIKKFYQCL